MDLKEYLWVTSRVKRVFLGPDFGSSKSLSVLALGGGVVSFANVGGVACAGCCLGLSGCTCGEGVSTLGGATSSVCGVWGSTLGAVPCSTLGDGVPVA